MNCAHILGWLTAWRGEDRLERERPRAGCLGDIQVLNSTDLVMDGIRGMSGERVAEGINPGRFHSPKNEGLLESGSAVSLLEREQVDMGFPGGSDGKESACHVGDLGWISGLGRSPAEGNSYLLQYSGLENSIDCIIHGV